MNQMHLKQKELLFYIGNASKVSEVLNKKIGLSLSIITNLTSALHLLLEALINLPKKPVFEHSHLLNTSYYMSSLSESF